MRRFFPVEELARDERFHTITNRERMGDPRTVFQAGQQPTRNNNRLTPSRKDASDAISRVRGRFKLPAGVSADDVMRDLRGRAPGEKPEV